MTSILSLFHQVRACILSENGAMNTMKIYLGYTPTNSYFEREIKSTFQQERLSRHYKIMICDLVPKQNSRFLNSKEKKGKKILRDLFVLDERYYEDLATSIITYLPKYQNTKIH
ncbi:unnamed protein product [Mucor hiemalis]